MASENATSSSLNGTQKEHILKMAHTVIALKSKLDEEPTTENETCGVTFMNFMKAYIGFMESGVTSEEFSENLLSYEEYWSSPRALQHATLEEASGALQAIRLMMDIVGSKAA